MALEKTWRWFGKKDSVTLSDLKQMGVEGVVTSLYHIPAGEVWPVEEIENLKRLIESYDMRWSVVESLPVPEDIKLGSVNSRYSIENYKMSLLNLGRCGIDTVCYNFMPVLDWARTDLHFKNNNGGESMLFDYSTFAAFDMYILKRKDARNDYPQFIREKALQIMDGLSKERQEELAHNIIIVTQAFIHGVVDENSDDYKKQFLSYLKEYQGIGKEELRLHLSSFLNEVVPVAEEAGVNLCIHPDDPPFPLLGLPRIVSTYDDIQWILSQNNSLSNGITFCTGSLSAKADNDLVRMARDFASRIHFVHLRNTEFCSDNSFYESGHLQGHVDMYSVVKVLLEEQIRRKKKGRKDIRIPFRPDHGVKILDDYAREANPGYPLIGRLKGLSELDGLQMGIERFLKSNNKM